MLYFNNKDMSCHWTFNKRTFLATLFILVLAGINFFFFSDPAGAFDAKPGQGFVSTGAVVKIDVRTLMNLIEMDPNLYLVDVRKNKGFKVLPDHIQQAVHIPLENIVKKPLNLPHDKTLVLISGSGPRSRMAAGILADNGYTVFYVKGGMEAWNNMVQNPKESIDDDRDTGDHDNKETVPIDEDMGC